MKKILSILIISAFSGNTIAQTDLQYFDRVINQYKNEVTVIEKQLAEKKFDYYEKELIGDNIYTFYSIEDEKAFPKNVSLIEFENELALVNTGKNYSVARSLKKTIEKDFTKPIKSVFILNSDTENSQAASFWIDQNISVYMHKKGINTYEKSFNSAVDPKTREVSSKLKWFKEFYNKEIEGELLNFRYYGQDLNEGTFVLEIPSRQFIFAGSLIITDKIPRFDKNTDTLEWVNSYARFMKNRYETFTIMPDFGSVSTSEGVERTTFEYLRSIQDFSWVMIKKGASIEETYKKMDLTRFSDMEGCYFTTKHNLNIVFNEYE